MTTEHMRRNIADETPGGSALFLFRFPINNVGRSGRAPRIAKSAAKDTEFMRQCAGLAGLRGGDSARK